MRSFRLGLGVLVLLLALGSSAGGAAAKPGYVRIPPSFSMQLRLPSSHGYALGVYAGRRQVAVTAEGHGATASYEARGVASGDGLAVDLGRFGRIDVRFHPTGPAKRETAKGCRGKPAEMTAGVAVGTIRFRGRDGFVTAARRRAPARIFREFGEVCSFSSPRSSYGRAAKRAPAPPPQEGDESGIFIASRRDHGQRVKVVAFANEVLELGFLGVSSKQRFGHVEVVDNAFEIGGMKNLSISGADEDPAKAHIAGPPPFAGSGDYESLPGGGATWSGSLRVHLPGEGVVPLTGPGFHARICNVTRPAAVKKCLGLPQGSGSQSQSLFDTRLSWSR